MLLASNITTRAYRTHANTRTHLFSPSILNSDSSPQQSLISRSSLPDLLLPPAISIRLSDPARRRSKSANSAVRRAPSPSLSPRHTQTRTTANRSPQAPPLLPRPAIKARDKSASPRPPRPPMPSQAQRPWSGSRGRARIQPRETTRRRPRASERAALALEGSLSLSQTVQRPAGVLGTVVR